MKPNDGYSQAARGRKTLLSQDAGDVACCNVGLFQETQLPIDELLGSENGRFRIAKNMHRLRVAMLKRRLAPRTSPHLRRSAAGPSANRTSKTLHNNGTSGPQTDST